MTSHELPIVQSRGIPSCSLDPTGLAAQRRRYGEIGREIEHAERGSGSLSLTLSGGVDRVLVEEALRVERACCPFFDLAYDPERRRLTIAVAEPSHFPALEAIASALDLEA